MRTRGVADEERGRVNDDIGSTEELLTMNETLTIGGRANDVDVLLTVGIVDDARP